MQSVTNSQTDMAKFKSRKRWQKLKKKKRKKNDELNYDNVKTEYTSTANIIDKKACKISNSLVQNC